MIGINITSYLPWVLAWPMVAAKAAKAAGYEFLQALPLRRLTPKIAKILPIRYLEDHWFYSGRSNTLLSNLRLRRQGDRLAPTLIDWVVFPEEKHCRKRYSELAQVRNAKCVGPIIIEHDQPVLWSDLWEISPRLRKGPRTIIKIARDFNTPLVLDLKHLRREPRLDELEAGQTLRLSSLGRWQDSIHLFLPNTALIHVNPLDRQELELMLAGKFCEAEDMMAAIKEGGFTGDYVVEATLGLQGINWLKLCRMLSEMRQWVAERT